MAVEVGVLVLGRQDPPHVAPPEPVARRVDVPVEVGEAVMDPVVAGPPERTLLEGGGAAEGHEELGHPAHAVAAVGEVAVVAGGDEEHPAQVQDGTQHPVLPGDHHEERGQRDEVAPGRGWPTPSRSCDGPVHRIGVQGRSAR